MRRKLGHARNSLNYSATASQPKWAKSESEPVVAQNLARQTDAVK